jgi:hypothetical protein
MLRQDVQARTTFAGDAPSSAAAPSSMRRSAARLAAVALRLIVAPFAAAAAALAGLAFAVLLPICGIATICEGIAKASWRLARDAFARRPHLPARRV